MRNTTKIALVSIILIVAMVLIPAISNAATNEGYTIELNYEGKVYEGIEHSATAILKGIDATSYSNARINVKVDGPATPVLLAKDSLGTEIDIAKVGYWGPENGFAVGTTFTNETPIKATFPKAGEYTITLSLVDMNNEQKVIVSEEYKINVLSAGDKLIEDINNAKDNDVIKLTGDVTLTKAIEVAGKNITIDGNGYSIKGTSDLVGGSPANKTLVTALTGAKINLVNVNLENAPKYGVQAYDGGYVSLNGVTISNCAFGGVLVNGGTIEVIDLSLGKNGTGANNGIEISKSKNIVSDNQPTLIMNGTLESTESENVIYLASDDNDATTEIIIENTESTTNKILSNGNKIVVANENNEVIFESNENNNVVIDGDELPTNVTVTIDVMGTTKKISFEVKKGTVLTSDDIEGKIDLKALGLDGYTLDGFYADSKYTEKFNFEKAIDTDTTVYVKVAKGEEKPDEKPEEKPEEKPDEKPDGDDEIVQTGDYIYIAVGALALVVIANVGYAVIKRNRK